MPVFEKSKVEKSHQKSKFHQSCSDMHHYVSKYIELSQQDASEISETFWRALHAHQKNEVSKSKPAYENTQKSISVHEKFIICYMPHTC